MLITVIVSNFKQEKHHKSLLMNDIIISPQQWPLCLVLSQSLASCLTCVLSTCSQIQMWRKRGHAQQHQTQFVNHGMDSTVFAMQVFTVWRHKNTNAVTQENTSAKQVVFLCLRVNKLDGIIFLLYTCCGFSIWCYYFVVKLLSITPPHEWTQKDQI